MRLHESIGGLTRLCATWMSEGANPKAVKEMLRDSLIPKYGHDTGERLANFVYDRSASRALEMLYEEASLGKS